MAEEKEEDKKEEEPEQEDKQEPEQERTTTDLIDRANEAAERIEKGNDRLNSLLNRQEKIQIEKALGGSAEAGKQETTEEQKIDEAARKQLEGTGFEDILFPKDKEKQ